MAAHSTLATQPAPTPSTNAVHIEATQPADYWAAADLHCRVFYDEKDLSEGKAVDQNEWKQTWLRFDRVMAIQITDSMQQKGEGRWVDPCTSFDVDMGHATNPCKLNQVYDISIQYISQDAADLVNAMQQ